MRSDDRHPPSDESTAELLPHNTNHKQTQGHFAPSSVVVTLGANVGESSGREAGEQGRREGTLPCGAAPHTAAPAVLRRRADAAQKAPRHPPTTRSIPAPLTFDRPSSTPNTSQVPLRCAGSSPQPLQPRSVAERTGMALATRHPRKRILESTCKRLPSRWNFALNAAAHIHTRWLAPCN